MGIVAAFAVPHPPLIVPSVGRGQEAGIQATIDAYREVARRIAALKPDTVIVSSPHAPFYRDCFYIGASTRIAGSMARFGAPQTLVAKSCDKELATAAIAHARKRGVPALAQYDSEMDHATFVPLYFLEQELSGYRVVRTGLSLLPFEEHRAWGGCLAAAADELGRRVVFVASGDLSHKLREDGPYGFVPEGPQFDARICALFSEGDLEGLFAFDDAFCDTAGECGLRSFQIMAGALEGRACSHELLSYEGPFGVGYAVAAYEPLDAAPAAESASALDAAPAPEPDAAADPFVAFARACVEGFVRTGAVVDPPDTLPSELLAARAGVFVSLHEHGELRGCIGTIQATTPSIACEIASNAASAASRDPRFLPVREDELDYLSYSVDVLALAEPIDDASKLDPVRYGVIVTKGSRRGLLLPNLDGVDTVEDQIAIAKRKAGIDVFDNDVELERFEVVRHSLGGEARRG